MGKFCQGKNSDKAQNLLYRVFKLSIPSGGVPDSPKMGKTASPLKSCPPANHSTERAHVKKVQRAAPGDIIFQTN